MRVGIILPGFSRDEHDWAIPVQLNLVRALAASADVRLLALRYPHQRTTYSVYGARVSALGMGQVRGVRRLDLWRAALLTLRRLHRAQPFDVLHAMWADECGLLAAWAGRLLGIPVVVSVAGGELAGFQDIQYGLQRSRFSRWVVGQALMGASRVVVTCQYVQRLISARGYPVPPDRLRIIPLGVDAALFQPALTPAPMPKRLLHVASLVAVKDQAVLLRALALLETDVTLDIVGSGPCEAALRAQAAALGLEQRVTFCGSLPHLQTPSCYQRAALHVLTSRHEGQGMVTLEAAACALPTVGTAVGLLPDDPALGETVAVGDAPALAAAIRALLVDDARRAGAGQAARRAVENRYTIQHTAANLLDVYRQVARA